MIAQKLQMRRINKPRMPFICRLYEYTSRYGLQYGYGNICMK